MSLFQTEFDEFCAAHGTPDRLELMLCDLNAILRGKWLPADSIDKFETGAVRLPMSTYAPNILGYEVEATGLGIAVGDPDGRLVPVPGTLKPVPWAENQVAQVLVEMTDHDGLISSVSPRQVLKTVLKGFSARGLRPVVSTELEFYLLEPRDEPSDAPAPPWGSPDAQNYDLEVLSRQETVLNDILSAAEEQGLPTDTLIAEYGAGQFEVNFHHTDDVLAAAETGILFRRLVRGVAAKHELEATFMAKPYADMPGNGLHVHASVLDRNGNNIFAAEEGVGETLQHAVAGVLTTMRDLQAIFAPHMNSYRRFQPGSFAPSAPDWGLDNRAAAIRLPETSGPGARLEHRISGADANPYLVLAAVLGGMMHGLETKPPLPLPLDDPDSTPATPLAADWTTAVERFAASDIAARIFGEEYRDIYAAVRRDEIAQLTTIISPMEYRYYLSRL
ncbi:glutamine synthetase family protein [Actibacterium sp. MT2.3-13A]|uniref:glutamine synthetase family protein n=1 Tax=Actibacterium sp. MT2.3-13A TaxID=2828332 RepID=UPI001BAA7D92|nr:glutamine synthetase family protein [Actibacterium sp. MT2.3-13A]